MLKISGIEVNFERGLRAARLLKRAALGCLWHWRPRQGGEAGSPPTCPQTARGHRTRCSPYTGQGAPRDSREENGRPSRLTASLFQAVGLPPAPGRCSRARGGQSSAGCGREARQVPGGLGHPRASLARDGGRSGLTCEADLDEVQRVQRQGGQDAAAHSRRQVLQPHVPQHGAQRRLA